MRYIFKRHYRDVQWYQTGIITTESHEEANELLQKGGYNYNDTYGGTQ